MTWIGELDGLDSSDVFADMDAALAKDAKVIVSDEEGAILTNW
jgi:hypothetical protein